MYFINDWQQNWQCNTWHYCFSTNRLLCSCTKKFRKKKNLHYFLLYLPCGKTELYKRVYKQCSEFLEKPNRSRGLVGQPCRIRRHFDCECSRGSSGESRGWRGHIPGRTHCDMLDRWVSTNTEKKEKKKSCLTVKQIKLVHKFPPQYCTMLLFEKTFPGLTAAPCIVGWLKVHPWIE